MSAGYLKVDGIRKIASVIGLSMSLDLEPLSEDYVEIPDILGLSAQY